jgi:hypothetical protein
MTACAPAVMSTRFAEYKLEQEWGARRFEPDRTR